MTKRKGNKSVKGNKGNVIIDNQDNVNITVAVIGNEVGDLETGNITELNDDNSMIGSLKRRKVKNASAGVDTESVSSSSSSVLKKVPNIDLNELDGAESGVHTPDDGQFAGEESDDGTEIPDDGQSAGEESDDETKIDDAAKVSYCFCCVLLVVSLKFFYLASVLVPVPRSFVLLLWIFVESVYNVIICIKSSEILQIFLFF